VNGDVTFAQSTTVNAKLYASGTVRFANNGGLTGDKCVAGLVPGCMNIGGNLIFEKNGNIAQRTDGTDIPEFHIAGSCTYMSVTTSPDKCGTTLPWTSTRIYAGQKDNNPDDPPFPPMTTSANPTDCASSAFSCIDFDSWYYNSAPGPFVPCKPGPNALPSTVFDGDIVRNGSVMQSFNLTPTSKYTCETGVGTLSWDPSVGNGELTIDGTVFIDGSAYVDGISNKAFSYKGSGAIMLSGSFSMQSGALCADMTPDKKDCDVDAASLPIWEPQLNALAIIADGNGYFGSPAKAQVPSGYSAYIKASPNTQFQGIIAGTNDVGMDTAAQVQGPIMSVFGSVSASQSLNLTFPPLPFAPASSPGQPPPTATLLDPQDFSGG
jgi:hypothetical protein